MRSLQWLVYKCQLPNIVLNLIAPSLWIEEVASVNDDLNEDGVILQVQSITFVLQHFLFNKQRTAAGDVHRHRRLLKAGTRWIWTERVRQVSTVVLLIDQRQRDFLFERPRENLVIITLQHKTVYRLDPEIDRVDRLSWSSDDRLTVELSWGNGSRLIQCCTYWIQH